MYNKYNEEQAGLKKVFPESINYDISAPDQT